MKISQGFILKSFLWLTVITAFGSGLLACASGVVRIDQVNRSALSIMEEAESLAGQGKMEEAVVLMQTIEPLHKDDSRVRAMMDKLSDEQKDAVTTNPWLGINKARRAKVHSATVEKIIWYLPDRLLDYIDMGSGHIGFGLQLGAGVWVTRGMQLRAVVGNNNGIG